MKLFIFFKEVLINSIELCLKSIFKPCQVHQGSPDVPLLRHVFQLFLVDPQQFLSQMRYIIPPASSGSAPWCPTRRAQYTSNGRRAGSILIIYPNHVNWHLLTWRSRGSTLRSLSPPQSLGFRLMSNIEEGHQLSQPNSVHSLQHLSAISSTPGVLPLRSFSTTSETFANNMGAYSCEY